MPFDLQALKNRKPVVVKRVVQTVRVEQSKAKRPTLSPQSASSPKPSPASRFNKSNARKSYPTPPAERSSGNSSRGVKRTASRATKSPSAIAFDSDSDDDDTDGAKAAKRARRKSTLDSLPTRDVRDKGAFDETQEDKIGFIHGSEMRTREKKAKFKMSFPSLEEGTVVSLRYPSKSPKEVFELIKPMSDGDNSFNAIDDMHATMKMVIKYYLPEEDREELDNDLKGYPYRLSRAVYKQDFEALKQVVAEWNKMLDKYRREGAIMKTLEKLGRVPKELVERILNQAHARTVSPEDSVLHSYEHGSNEVYGELLPRFVSKILLEDTQTSAEQVFVDLGSGVGNVVLQAALEVGCEAWGCEIKPEYCRLADAQKVEFEARCRLWGLSHGAIRLEQGDFCENNQIKEVLRRADVIVVNNEVFRPELNENLTTLFLDLKEGCKIVSLKSFVPHGHKITARNVNNPVNLLRVEQKTYFSDCVSWKNEQGSYFVSTKDSSMLEAFARRQG